MDARKETAHEAHVRAGKSVRNRYRGGAAKKSMQVWKAASENPGASICALARAAGVTRPTVYKWLAVEGWEAEYKRLCQKEPAKKRGASR